MICEIGLIDYVSRIIEVTFQKNPPNLPDAGWYYKLFFT